MPNATDVAPQRWTNIKVLFDNGYYSAIYGDFRDKNDPPKRRLGVRWNGSPGTAGYPSLAGNPLWYCEPDFLEQPILTELLNRVLADPANPHSDDYEANIRAALAEIAGKP